MLNQIPPAILQSILAVTRHDMRREESTGSQNDDGDYLHGAEKKFSVVNRQMQAGFVS